MSFFVSLLQNLMVSQRLLVILYSLLTSKFFFPISVFSFRICYKTDLLKAKSRYLISVSTFTCSVTSVFVKFTYWMTYHPSYPCILYLLILLSCLNNYTPLYIICCIFTLLIYVMCFVYQKKLIFIYYIKYIREFGDTLTPKMIMKCITLTSTHVI